MAAAFLGERHLDQLLGTGQRRIPVFRREIDFACNTNNHDPILIHSG